MSHAEYIRDEQGRVVALSRRWQPEDEPLPGMGKDGKNISVCGICSKEMTGCWDTVCFLCLKTNCYMHSNGVNMRWVCDICYPGAEQKIATMEGRLLKDR